MRVAHPRASVAARRRATATALALAATLLAVGLVATDAGAASFRIVNMDGPGEGFNDPTAVAPVGGNPGTTLGEQRLHVVETAARIWGAILPSKVEIRVQASFDALYCAPDRGVLGAASPIGVYTGFPGQLVEDTWYHGALANRLAGRDLAITQNDILAQFNSSLDDDGCLGSVSWYYGLDGNEGNDTDLLNVVLHELGHGLGFSTVVDLGTGALLAGIPDLYSTFLYDRVAGLHWNEMTDAGRRASAERTGEIVWDGPAVTRRTAAVLERQGHVRIESPAAIAGELAFGSASFGPRLGRRDITAAVALVEDGQGSPTDACSPIVNVAALAGRIALIDRGSCPFIDKVSRAQAAGAVAVVIVNTTATLPILIGDDPSITIPSVVIPAADGDAIKARLGGGVTITLGPDPNGAAVGTDPQGRLMLYAPNPLQGGSSISHWDVSATPNLLMEPFTSHDLTGNVDLTPDLFEDLGWFAGVARPSVARLGDAFPNPFQSSPVTIPFELDRAGALDVAIHDLNGRLVRRLMHGAMPAGPGVASWDGTDESGRRMRPGVYLCRLRFEGASQARRLVLVK